MILLFVIKISSSLEYSDGEGGINLLYSAVNKENIALCTIEDLAE